MTLFEYLAAAYVLVLSFALVRGISGVPFAVLSAGRYWVHALWLLTALGNCLVSFWAFWSFRDVEWTLAAFVGSISIPVLLFAYISLLVPPDPSEVGSWRDYYFRVRVPLFSTSIAMQSAIVISVPLTLGVPALHPTLLMNYLHIALSSLGLSTARPRVHAALVVAYVLLLAAYLARMTEPGSILETPS